MYVSEKKDGEDIEVRQRDGGWQLVAGEDRNSFRSAQCVRNGDVGYHGDCGLFGGL